MTEDGVSMRSKQLELFSKMHLGMDHVLSKLLQDAPPLPNSLKLLTETQSLSSTWVQVTEIYEKRRSMLQRRKEKEKNKSKLKRRQDVRTVQKEQEKEVKNSSKKESKKRPSASEFPRTTKSYSCGKGKKKSVKKKTTSVTDVASVKEGRQSIAYNELILKKVRKLPLCGNVVLGSNKFKAVVKWMELDKGNNAPISTELTKLVEKLQHKTASEKTSKLKLSRKRSLDPLDDVYRVEERKSKQKNLTEDRKFGNRQPGFCGEDEVVYKSQKKEKKTAYKEGNSRSNKAELVSELQSSSSPIVRPQKKGEMRLSKRHKLKMEEMNEKEFVIEMTSREHLATAALQNRADKVTLVNEIKDSFYEEKEQPVKPGASSRSAIVLDDSEDERDEEGEEEGEAEFSVEIKEEEFMEAQEQDSSTDDDRGVFDLNEEDIFVVDAILCVKEGRVLLSAGGLRRHKESDLYLVKWEGYNELTWEPDENIPRRLIEMFRERERAKRACQYQIKVAHERREVINLTTQTREIIYKVQWINQDLPVWELRTALPTKAQIWLDKVLGGASAKKRRDAKAVKQSD
ncbi:unnamed protein product [Peronospora belbahrii]|uniref:Chromo domain-containing protein n=1 Tax=Peronospora belbahrii TaxID=622444 RepID=A0ABN8CT35_9STRA|nr:unnamed protein product [Peronospora belbahrii]